MNNSLFQNKTFLRWRHTLAGGCGVIAIVALWVGLGLSRFLPFPTVAVAESSSQQYQNSPPSSLVSPQRAALLQSSVDSVVLGLEGILAALPDEKTKHIALASALNSLTFKLGEEIYFTAWEETRMLHSPLTPDTVNMDFAHALDENGSSFVQAMLFAATGGGGFTQVALPRQLPRTHSGLALAPIAPVPLRMNMDDAMLTQVVEKLSANILNTTTSAGYTVSPLATTAATTANGLQAVAPVKNTTSHAQAVKNPVFTEAPLMDSAAVPQVVYSRTIPYTSWYIAAFMPADAVRSQEGFTSAWAAASSADTAYRQEGSLRKGLCISGLSFAGLAGLLIAPGMQRKREEDEDEA